MERIQLLAEMLCFELRQIKKQIKPELKKKEVKTE